jgi:hypothetical protein
MHMSKKPPHSATDVFFSFGKDLERKNRENRAYSESYNKGRGFRDGQKSK